MRTSEARRMRDRALKSARKHGHDVALISKSGAVELYGCLNDCDSVMDIWDSPAIVNGPMAESKCSGGLVGGRFPPVGSTKSPSPWMAIAYRMVRAPKYFYHRALKFCKFLKNNQDDTTDGR